MTRFAIAAFVAAFFSTPFAAPAAAQTGCGDVMEAFRVGTPQDRAAAAQRYGFEGCSAVHQELFRINGPAIDRAVPMAPEDVVGTWLGDDVLLMVQGVVVPGQEVLRLSLNEDGDLILEQYWYKAAIPGSIVPHWDLETGYAGRVMRAELQQEASPGEWSVPFDRPIFYDGLTFEHERSYQVYVLGRLNHFEVRSIRLSGIDDTLVLRGFVFPQPVRDDYRQTVTTYTRVADAAPDLALQTTLFFNLSQSQYFECLIHEFSDGKGPFLDHIAPHTMADLADLYARMMTLTLERVEIMDNEGDAPTPESDELLFDVMYRILTVNEEPLVAKIIEALSQNDICFQW